MNSLTYNLYLVLKLLNIDFEVIVQQLETRVFNEKVEL